MMLSLLLSVLHEKISVHLLLHSPSTIDGVSVAMSITSARSWVFNMASCMEACHYTHCRLKLVFLGSA